MGTEQIKLLLIEDDKKDARLIKSMLGAVTGAVFDVETSERLSAGIRRLAKEDIDLVLLDLSLPDSRGLKTLTKVQEQYEVPIIIITGLDDESTAIEALHQGAQDYLVKGQIDGNILPRSVRYAIERHRDTMKRKESEDKLREAERRYRTIFDNPLQMVYVFDSQGIIIDANDCAIARLGYPREDLGKSSFKDIVHPDDLPIVLDGLKELLTEGYMESLAQVRLVAKSGELIWVEVHASRIDQGEGEYQGLGIARDITDRKQTEEALIESKEKLRAMVEKLRLSQEALSTPVVQIWDKVLALPLIGAIDEHRAQQIMEVLLEKIVDTQSELIILDVTGVSSIDTHVANHLVQTIDSVSLLGARCILTGIQPEVAQAVVKLGVEDMNKVTVKRDLQDGLKWALQYSGYGSN